MQTIVIQFNTFCVILLVSYSLLLLVISHKGGNNNWMFTKPVPKLTPECHTSTEWVMLSSDLTLSNMMYEAGKG